MGISRDNWHKRRKTGGKRKPYHKKRKYELGRPPANTKIGPRRIHTVRVRGGNKKYRALRLDVGNFSWGSECCTRKTRIIDVVYNASNNELVRTKTLVKNCIVLIDSTPYRQWYEAHYALPLGRKKGAKLTPEEEEILNKKRSKKIQKKYDERKKNAKIASILEEQFQQGKLLVTPLLAGRGNLLLELELVHVPARLLELIIPGWPLGKIVGLKNCKMSKDPWSALCVRKMSHKLVTALTGFKF
ncbi:40S ribosomal protein S8 isoform X1 [Aquila chrysaetos chrysaetos]|uniref:40S ribosomal protein S8 n=1 Tax=Aquila chrysaetos chrysaetos TaxID=223781 RepID=A0A663EI84_AQUCH|nr:40S ribosomal protein S8 isoform X1 [Aquila chrysaetos chrysaetos]